MIKKTTIIRNITDKQKKQLAEVQEAEKIKSVSKTFLFTLEQYLEQKKDIARLNRIIELKQKKIESLNEKLDEKH